MNDERERLLEDWTFNWGALDVLIGGKSAIDLSELRIRDEADATDFLRCYGYDPEDEEDGKVIHGAIVEAWHFIAHHLMPEEWGRGIRPPEDLFYATDARSVLLAASDASHGNRLRQAWACSLLRVMHTIAHIEGVTRLLNIDEARSQILGPIRAHVFRDANAVLRFGTSERNVELLNVDWKYHKSRNSILLKLLHKSGNVAENIYDYLGVRIVTKQLRDVVRVVKFLRDMNLMSFPNANPGRARNSLIDMEHFKAHIKAATRQLEESKIDTATFNRLVEEATAVLDKKRLKEANPHSGRDYRAVQMTGRQLIRVPSPMRLWQKKLEQLCESRADLPAANRHILEEIVFFSRRWRREDVNAEYAGFFPFEVHVLDEKTYLANRTGDASHDRYKRSQVRAARKRVLGRLLSIVGEMNRSKPNKIK